MNIDRRHFLVAAATMPLAMRANSIGLPVPKRIQGFCIDFNWRYPRQDGWINDFARPGHWADASPEQHVDWYAGIGANVIQTFCVSCNGYAWYKGGAVPEQPGLRHDFLRRVVELGHKKNIFVTGYFCAGANTKWAFDHPDLSYGTPSNLHIPYTDAYLDYLGRSIDDAVRNTGIDGYMLDWLWNPAPELRRSGWIPAEKRLFEQLTGLKFPANGVPGDADILAYERAAIERCWRRVHETTKSANKDAVIWLSCNNLAAPAIAGTRVLQEADWVLNESPSREYYQAGQRSVGARTRLIQCLVGWKEHNAKLYLPDPQNAGVDLYGFAEPRDQSMPLPAGEYLRRSIESFEGPGGHSTNDSNIAALARGFHGLPMDAVR